MRRILKQIQKPEREEKRNCAAEFIIEEDQNTIREIWKKYAGTGFGVEDA
jgi:hypothetical protein